MEVQHVHFAVYMKVFFVSSRGCLFMDAKAKAIRRGKLEKYELKYDEELIQHCFSFFFFPTAPLDSLVT